MSRYGIDIYGVGYYGAGTLTLVDFDASPFEATPLDYGQIQLRWVVPSGDWGSIRLVRNRYGFPLTADDGDVLFDIDKATAPNYFIDEGDFPTNVGLLPGVDYFYSLFVLKTSDGFWAKAGDAYTISPQQYAKPTSFYTGLPEVYQSKSYKSISLNSGNDDLASFLNIFETYYDFMKTYAELFLNTYDPTLIHYPALPYMMQQFGSKFEPALGVQQSRIFLRNIMLLNKNKGSLQGLKDFIKAFTGWEPLVFPTANLMLNYNDSSFEESVGGWENIANGELSVISSSNLVPYNEPTSPALFPNKQKGSLKLKALSSGAVEIACGLSDPLAKGIPVEPGFTYTFSVFTQAAATARKVYLDIRWYDRLEQEISRAGEANKTNSTGGWNTRVSTTGPAPEYAYFAVPYIRVEGCVTDEIHYFDAAQFEVSSEGATNYVEARGVNIYLLANRVNLLSNPSFDSITAPWVVDNATMTRDLTEYSGGVTGSTSSVKLDALTNAPVTLRYNDYIEVGSNEWYTFSGYVRTAYTGAYVDDRVGGFDFEWYDEGKNYISTTGVVNKLLTEYYKTTEFYRTNGVLTITLDELPSLSVGDEVRLVNFNGTYGDHEGEDILISDLDGNYTVSATLGASIQMVSSGADIDLLIRKEDALNSEWLIQDLKLDFIQQFGSEESPENAKFVKPIFDWENAKTGQTIWLDAMMLEQSTSVKSYFDGEVGVSQESDLLWEGAAGESRSHYYKNKNAVEKRLIAELPKYLYINQWFAVYFATTP